MIGYGPTMEIKIVDFETILPVWEEKLWPNRKDPIKPTNNISYLGGRDKRISSQTPVFFAAYNGDNIVGVNSGFPSMEGSFRSRGLWVDPTCRGQGIGNGLLQAVVDYATEHGYKYAWSMPRQSALPCYLSVGFEQTSEFFDKGVEFGPNCFVRIELSD